METTHMSVRQFLRERGMDPDDEAMALALESECQRVVKERGIRARVVMGNDNTLYFVYDL